MSQLQGKETENIDSMCRYFFENSPDPLIVHGLEQGIIAVNAAALQLFSVYESRELKGHTLVDFSPDFQIQMKNL